MRAYRYSCWCGVDLTLALQLVRRDRDRSRCRVHLGLGERAAEDPERVVGGAVSAWLAGALRLKSIVRKALLTLKPASPPSRWAPPTTRDGKSEAGFHRSASQLFEHRFTPGLLGLLFGHAGDHEELGADSLHQPDV